MNEYEKAQAVIRRRLEIESALLRALRAECVRVIMEIASLGYASEMAGMEFRLSNCGKYEDILDLLGELRLWIYMNVTHYSQMAVDVVEEHWKPVVPLVADEYANREIHGKTLKERVAIYVNRLKSEAEMWIAAGLVGGMSLKKLEKEVREWVEKPYSSRLFLAASAAGGHTTAGSVRLRRGVPHFGAGQLRGAVASLARLGGWVVADMVRMAEFLAWGSDSRVTGYRVYRGSSYPCSLCDMMTGFHPKGFEELPPYHARCCCFAVPVIDDSVS